MICKIFYNLIGFFLRKQTASDPDLLPDLRSENNDSMLVLELENEMAKVLGVLWYPENYIFQYKVQVIRPESQSKTKRDMLSKIASFFDPLGLVGPTILIQEMQKLKIDWDKPVPCEIHNEWKKYLNELKSIQELFISRFLCTEDKCHVKMHGYADASLAAYGAYTYARQI